MKFAERADAANSAECVLPSPFLAFFKLETSQARIEKNLRLLLLKLSSIVALTYMLLTFEVCITQRGVAFLVVLCHAASLCQYHEVLINYSATYDKY